MLFSKTYLSRFQLVENFFSYSAQKNSALSLVYTSDLFNSGFFWASSTRVFYFVSIEVSQKFTDT